MAKLYFRYGAMNSGKSTGILQVAHNYEEQGMRILLLKPFIDTKAGGKVLSRLGLERAVDHLIRQDDDVFELIKACDKEQSIACVLVDEVQFLTEKQIDQLFETAVIQGIPIICYGLRTDFMLRGFPASQRLLLLAHSIEELKTICRCGKKAVANARMIGGRFVFEGDQVAIDEENDVTYEAMCAACYFKMREDAAKKRLKGE